jgi:hypothetical protein
MILDTSRIDLILQYALLLAGEEDDYFDRQLGPIHLIKYVYLADLFYAKRNKGETYTGVNWQFYKFGPWTQSVNERIEPALSLISADKKVFPSEYINKDEWVRYWLRDEQLLSRKEDEIPATIKLNLKRDVHKFKQDTPSLLDYVYCSKPMLSAAPNEYLDFSLAVEEPYFSKSGSSALKINDVSEKKMKKFKERMNSLADNKRKKLSNRKKLINIVSSPRYDDVYDKGVSWLEDLAGPEISQGEKRVEFSEDIWKSSARKGEDVS